MADSVDDDMELPVDISDCRPPRFIMTIIESFHCRIPFKRTHGSKVDAMFDEIGSPLSSSHSYASTILYAQYIIFQFDVEPRDSRCDVPLTVKFSGSLSGANIHLVVEALLEMNLREKNFPHFKMLELEHDSGLLKMFVRRFPNDWPRDRLYRSVWFSVTDSGGVVEQDSRKILDSVAIKSAILGQYKKNVAARRGVPRGQTDVAFSGTR